MGFMKNQIDDPKRVFGLDLMRAIAILMVVFAHCVWLFPESNGPFTQILNLFGFLGVEIFFVLSGFLIGRILYKLYIAENFTAHSVMKFLKRRWFRTLPNYYLVLLVNIAIAALIGYEISQTWRYFVFLQNFSGPLLPFFPESWSLSIEEFAYIFLPAMLMLVAFLRLRNRSLVFVAMTIILIAACIYAKFDYHQANRNTSLDHWNVALKSVVIYRIDAIFIGVFCSWLYSVYRVEWRRTRFVWAVLGFVMMGFFTAGVGFLGLFIDRYPLFWNVLYLPLASVSIALFLPMLSEWKTEIRIVKYPITFISLISYSVYLLHYSVILQSLKQFGATDGFTDVQLVVMTTAYFTLTFILSYLLFRFYEKPITDLREPSVKTL